MTIFASALLVGGRGPVAVAGAALAAAIVLGIGARRAFAPVSVAIAGTLVALFALGARHGDDVVRRP